MHSFWKTSVVSLVLLAGCATAPSGPDQLVLPVNDSWSMLANQPSGTRYSIPGSWQAGRSNKPDTSMMFRMTSDAGLFFVSKMKFPGDKKATDLTDKHLRSSGRYAAFEKKTVLISGLEGIQIDGTPKAFRRGQLRHFFVARGGTLYGFGFEVYRADQWAIMEPVIQKVTESFQLL